jgi:hypothetical protein
VTPYPQDRKISLAWTNKRQVIDECLNTVLIEEAVSTGMVICGWMPFSH